MKSPCFNWVVGVAFTCLFVGQALADIYIGVNVLNNDISGPDESKVRNTKNRGTKYGYKERPYKSGNPKRGPYRKQSTKSPAKVIKTEPTTTTTTTEPTTTTTTTELPTTTTTTEAPTTVAMVPTAPAFSSNFIKSVAIQNSAMVQSSSSGSLSVNIKKVSVTVIYECLCPHSQEFIRSQLLPTYKKLQDRLHVTLLPFGKARLNQSGTTNNGATTNGVICEHGDAECEGNKIQTCVAQVAKETLQAIEVVACMSNYKAPNSAAQKCVKASGVSWTMVHECVTRNGSHYVLQVAQETWKLQKNVTRVPLIAVNGEVSSYIQEESQTNFMSLTCQKIGGVGTDKEPEPCAEERRRRRRRR
uniref:Putative gamma-interferon inducible lysosomal thiol reductase n=1 Tax=Ixodes ricinus TaxID=34613 RepID=A0A6B0V8J5_IXORI